jgi:hypothetical protein
VRVFQVALDDARPAKPISQPHNAASAVRRRWSTRAGAIGTAVVLIAGAVYFHLGRAPVQLSDQLAKPSERFSIVVLPFANLSGDANQDYLADVISDELTTGLSSFRVSLVFSRSTAFTYKGKPINLRQIGKDLGVRYALEGSVQSTTRSAFFATPPDDAKADLLRADELASLAIKIDPAYHTAHAVKGDVLAAAGRYREAIDSYGRAQMLAPNTILLGLPMAYNFIGEPKQAIAYADKAMRLSPHIPGRVGPIFYFAKAIAFSMLHDFEQALVWIERAEAAAPDILLMGFVRSGLLAVAGKEDEARAAMQRYLANETAPIRTMSQWHARQPEKTLPSYNPLVLARLLMSRKKFEDGLRTAGLPE